MVSATWGSKVHAIVVLYFLPARWKNPSDIPPMTALLPKSVQPSPPETIPPTWCPGSRTMTRAPSRAAATAAITPAAVAP
jgi:hypothetical protein